MDALLGKAAAIAAVVTREERLFFHKFFPSLQHHKTAPTPPPAGLTAFLEPPGTCSPTSQETFQEGKNIAPGLKSSLKK